MGLPARRSPAESVFLAGLPGARAAGRRRRARGALRQALRGARGRCRRSSRRRARAKLIGTEPRGDGDGRAPRASSARCSSEAQAELPALFIVSKVVLADGPLARRGRARAGREVRALLDLRRGPRRATPAHPTLCGEVRGRARMSKRPRLPLGAPRVLFVALVLADQWTKFLAVERLTTRLRARPARRRSASGCAAFYELRAPRAATRPSRTTCTGRSGA